MANNSFSILAEALKLQGDWERAHVRGPHISRRKADIKVTKPAAFQTVFDRYCVIKGLL